MSDDKSALQEQIERIERQLFLASKGTEDLDEGKPTDSSGTKLSTEAVESLEGKLEDLQKRLRSLD